MNFDNYLIATEEDIQGALNCAIQQIKYDLNDFTDKFKVNGSVNNFYEPKDNISWTSGFWTGQIWMAYEMTNDLIYRKAAEKQVTSFLHRIENHIETDHHDMGFLYSLSCVAGYKLTGSEEGRIGGMLAAENLISRYQEDGEFIQAWGGNVGADDNYRLIIDCLLNLPLLYWASETSGDSKYAEIARKHIDTSLKVIMREDHSTYHTYYFEKGTGKPLYGETRQGYSNDSAWSRGQAWGGIYGTALSYMYTGNESYKERFFDIADYFMDHSPKDLVPYWDYYFEDGTEEPKDSSAAAIAVCGILEMVKHLSKEEGAKYKSFALKVLKSLIENYAVKDPQVSNGLLQHGVYARKSPFNPCNNRNVDECNTWGGDYYYMEALVRLSKDWQLYW